MNQDIAANIVPTNLPLFLQSSLNAFFSNDSDSRLSLIIEMVNGNKALEPTPTNKIPNIHISNPPKIVIIVPLKQIMQYKIQRDCVV